MLRQEIFERVNASMNFFSIIINLKNDDSRNKSTVWYYW